MFQFSIGLSLFFLMPYSFSSTLNNQEPDCNLNEFNAGSSENTGESTKLANNAQDDVTTKLITRTLELKQLLGEELFEDSLFLTSEGIAQWRTKFPNGSDDLSVDLIMKDGGVRTVELRFISGDEVNIGFGKIYAMSDIVAWVPSNARRAIEYLKECLAKGGTCQVKYMDGGREYWTTATGINQSLLPGVNVPGGGVPFGLIIDAAGS